MVTEIDELTLTAYALGELDPAERPMVEALMASDGRARRIVADVRATARVVAAGLATEPQIGLLARHRAAVEQRLAERPVPRAAPRAGRRIAAQWPWWGSLAASVMVAASVGATVVVPAMSSAPDATAGGFGPRGAKPADARTTDQPPLIGLDARAGGARDPRDAQPAGDAEWPQLAEAPVPGSGAAAARAEAGFAVTAYRPVSAFPAAPVYPDDVDRGSLASLRRALARGELPRRDAVRTDELVNAFAYHDAPPRAGETLGASAEVAECPWNPAHRLVRIGIKAAGSPAQSTVVARDVSIRVEFNPGVAAAYRLIGYEPRPVPGASLLGGDAVGPEMTSTWSEAPPVAAVAAGRTVTALYEVVPVGRPVPSDLTARPPDPLRYQKVLRTPVGSDELMTVSVRYRATDPAGTGTAFGGVRTVLLPVTDTGATVSLASDDFHLAAAAATFGLALRGGEYKGSATLHLAERLAADVRGTDEAGARAEFAELVKKARQLAAGEM